MKLIELKCRNCGSKLKVAKDSKNIICQFCGANFKLDDETIHIEHKIINDKDERMFHNIEIYLENEEYGKAKNILDKLVDEYPDDSRIYKGYIGYLTHNFSADEKYYYDEELFNKIEENYKKYCKYQKNSDNEFERNYKEMIENRIKSIVSENEKWKEQKKVQDEKDRVYAIITLVVIIIIILFVVFGV